MRSSHFFLVLTLTLLLITAGCFRLLSSASRPLCETDNDCPTSQSCGDDGNCHAVVSQPRCANDSDCPLGQGCDDDGNCRCDETFCDGCCGDDGTCRDGLEDVQCGLDGGQCENCSEGGLACELGACVPISGYCEDECPILNQCICTASTSIRCCENNDDDDCLEWGSEVECASGTLCEDGHCVDVCPNPCDDEGATECVGETRTHRCLVFDGCLQWGPLIECSDSEICEGGDCVASCTASCEPLGVLRCSTAPGGIVEVCADPLETGCLDWTTEQICAEPLVCQDGACVEACVDECASVGRTDCLDDDTLRTCVAGDSGCTEWLATICSDGSMCLEDSCIFACSSDCTIAGEVRCLNLEVIEICTDEGLWCFFGRCDEEADGEVCVDGVCIGIG